MANKINYLRNVDTLPTNPDTSTVYLTSDSHKVYMGSQEYGGAGSISVATTTTDGLMSSTDKTKLNGIATGAEVNQNAFSNVTVGSTTIAADSKTDTLTLVAGSNVSLTPDATNDKITISANDTSKQYRYQYGTTSTLTNKKIKININSDKSWMLCFTVTIYQQYTPIKVMVSGYHYGTSHWYGPQAYLIGNVNTNHTSQAVNVYFGYDSANELWVGFDADNYTGISIDDVSNGYAQITDYENLFSISVVDSLGDNIAATKTVRTATFLSNVPTDGQVVVADGTGGKLKTSGYTIAKSVPSDAKFTDTTYESKAAASGGTDVSLVTTGEKYTWNSSNSAAKAFYGTCSTAAATATKVVTLSSAVGWNLVAGVVIGVKFSNNNTASSVKLDVNGSGAKSIYFGNAVYAGTSVQITGWKDYIIYYMYDGTNWMFLNNSYNFTDSNNYVTQTATATSADYEVLFSNTADNTTRTESARKNSNLTFNPSTGDLHTTQLNGVTIGSSPKFTDTTYSNATQSAAGLMSSSDKTKLDKMYTVVTTEAELTSALATANNNILVVNSFTLTKTIAITQNNTNLTFAKNVVFDMSGKAFAFITVGTANTKPTYVTINNPKAQGNKTSGSIGINLLGMGFGGSINSPTLQSFDTGIKTNSFDCAQLISLYEPVVQGCNIGIDDSLGGLQAVRIYGGRIEGNTNWGVKIGSPNSNFMGTVIEGNGTNLSNGGEVYFTNVSTNRSSAVFVNCYFETLSTTAGNIITANSNWLGNVSLMNCEIYNLSIPVFTYTGSDTKERAINITGGNVKGTVMLNVPNVGNSTSIFISNVLYDDSTNAIDANIGANANKFISGKNVSTTSIVRGKSFMAGNTKDGVKSAENVYSKILQIDTPSGNNNFIRLTQSASNPWADTSVGILKGSLHYNSATNRWYQRVTSKGTTDAEANWSPLILATTPHTEISTSGSGNSLYFSMPAKSQWVGKKICICAWRTNESDSSKNPPKFMWEFYVPTNWSASSDDFDIYSAYRGSMGTLHDTYITVSLDYSNNRISLQDDGFYARNLNGTSFYLYLYHSLMTYKLVIL